MTEKRQDRWLLLALLCLPTMSILLSVNIVMAALVPIRSAFPESPNIAVWTLLAYSITAASLSVPAGAMGDRYGLRRLYSGGLIIFLLGALGASLANSGGLLVLSRIFSGIGSAVLAPVALAFLNRLFSGSEKPIAFGYWSASVTIGVVVGPLLGGWIQTIGSWRLVFPAAALPALLALIMLHRLPKFLPDRTLPPMDIKGFVGLAALPFLALFTITEAGNLNSVNIGVLLALIVTVFALTWRHLHRCQHPAILISKIRESSWWRPTMLQLIIRCTFMAMLTLLTTYFHSVEGKAEFVAAQNLFPFCLAVGLASLSSGFMCRALGARRVLIIVFTLALMGLVSLGWVTTSGFRLQDWIAIIAIGLLVGNTGQLSRLAMANFSVSESMRGAGLNTLIIQLGLALGAALPSFIRSTFFGHAGLGYVTPANQLVNAMHADIIALAVLCGLGVWQAFRLSHHETNSPGAKVPIN